MNYTVDRFEENFALLEDQAGAMRQVPRSVLPAGTREGDRLTDSEGRFSLLPEEGQTARAQADARLRRLLERNRKPSE